jgi:DNA-binding transcriptional LysR family regulator
MHRGRLQLALEMQRFLRLQQRHWQAWLDFWRMRRYAVGHFTRRGVERGLMDIDQLQAFLAIVDHGSVLGAAEALKLPRSTVRAKLDALEQEFGVALMTRTRDGAEATSAGMALAERARALVNQLRALPSSVREEMNVPTGELHLRAPVGPPPELMGLLVGLFRERYPQVPLHLSFAEEPTLQMPADTDLILHFGPTIPRGPFRTQVLLTMDEHLLATPEYLAEHGVPQSLAELQAHPLLMWRAPGEDGRSLPTRAGGLVPVTPVMVSSDIHLLRMMAAAGCGIGFLPTPPLQTSPQGEDFVTVMPDIVARQCALRLVVPEARAAMPRIRAAVELIRELVDGGLGFPPPDEA